MKVHKNNDIRENIKKNGIWYCEIANAIGVSEATLYRWLRNDLTEGQRAAINEAVKKLMAE